MLPSLRCALRSTARARVHAPATRQVPLWSSARKLSAKSNAGGSGSSGVSGKSSAALTALGGAFALFATVSLVSEQTGIPRTVRNDAPEAKAHSKRKAASVSASASGTESESAFIDAPASSTEDFLQAKETEALNTSASPSPTDPDADAEGSNDNGGGAAYNPETGEINWDCPCLGGMAHGPCGEDFRAAFSCFVYSEAEPKGIECVERFQAMQDCFRRHPEVYGEEIMSDDDEGDASEQGEVETIAASQPESEAAVASS